MGSADNSDIIGFIFNFNIYAYLAELRGDRLQVLRYYIFKCDITAGRRGRYHKRSRFYLIRNYGIFRAMKLWNTLYLDNISTCAHYICAHWIKEVSKVNYMRLFCRVLDNSQPFRLGTGKKCIYCAADRYLVKIYLSTYQLVRRQVYYSVLDISLCTKRFKALDMLIYRSASEIAPSGKRNARLFEPAEQCSQEVTASSCRTCKLVRHCAVTYSWRIDLDLWLAESFDDRTHTWKDLQSYLYIAYRRYVFQNTLICRKYRRGNYRNRRIFSAAYLHFASERSAAFYNKLFQKSHFLNSIKICKQIIVMP